MKNQNEKIKYLPRVLARNENRDKDILSPIADMEFARLLGPKVLLGAPGGGKTSVCEEVARQLNGQLVQADDVACGSFDTRPESEGQILVIDGLDEVSSKPIPEAFAEIIKTIKNLGYDNWLISCRSYEWRKESLSQRIQSVFQQSPEIAHLGDLSGDEIKAFLEVFLDDSSAEQFIKDAERKEATDFLQNPQTLQMLVQAVDSGGWPTTKTKLFHIACTVMASEDNPLHREKNPDRPNEEQMVDIAGWICAQLLMSGKQAIALDGQGSENVPRPADLEDSEYSIEDIKAACQTKLFKPAGAGHVEPAHRTVAEFLAGRWLAKAFKAEPRKISPARVMNYLTSFGTGAIPPDIHGLYAWIVSLDDSNRYQNIKHNPYVCLRYGDLSNFSDGELIAFLKEFRAFAEKEPFFLGENWYAQLSRGLGRASIKDDFLDTISNGAPHQLVVALLRAIKGTDLANAMVDELKGIALDQKTSSSERFAAIEALEDSLEPNDWVELAGCLLNHATENSLKLSIDGIITNKPEYFSGQNIAAHLIAYEHATASNDRRSAIWVGFSIPWIHSEEQVLEIAQSLAAEMPMGMNYDREDGLYNLKRWLSELLLRLLKGANKLTAHQIWPLISRLSNPVRGAEWEEVATSWFSEHREICREIQSLALNEAWEHSSNCWNILSWLSKISPGLDMDEDDFVYHFKKLVITKNKFSNWQSKWRDLLSWARYTRCLDGSVLTLANGQAEDFPELKSILEEILHPPINEDETKFEKRRREWNKKELARTQERHENFSEVRESMEKGERIDALGDAARATLGYYHNLKETPSPKENITEMVGQENLASVVAGFKAAVKRDDVPSVRDCINLRVYESSGYHLEIISLALSMLMIESGESLTLLPKKAQLCVLSASWSGLSGESKKLSEEAREKIECILFEDQETKMNFIKDMVEPSLEVGKESPSAFWRLGREEVFFDVLSELALEWLTKFENVDERITLDLLNIAIRFADDKNKLADIIEEKIKNDDWVSKGHRCAWYVAAFLLDFDRFQSAVCKFANEDKQHFWSFRHMITGTEYEKFSALSLSAKQIAFLLETFAHQWPVSSPPSSWSGSNNPWDASNYLQNLIRMLSGEGSGEVIECLESLVASGRMATYQNYVKHELANAKRAFAETHHQKINLKDVREILSSGEPVNVSDLQTLFIEEFEEYQARVRTGHTDIYKTFWIEDEKPHVENYCRDRLLDGLEQEMGRYGVRVHKEGALANETRVDLLLSCGDFDLPIEIKRQWHPDIWTAAREQLERYYTDNYRTDGTGVYLVIWHGDVEGKAIPNPPKGERPESADEMRQSLLDNSGDLSPKTKIVVLDVSKPERNR